MVKMGVHVSERIPLADSTNDTISKDWSATVFSYSAAVKGRLD